ncbi:MAG TPA: TonB-dependent receptor, partial [Thermoanaerobaculia bacterium]|nr:TonB-dependent receptor [Thermoanaerobaculia bacterium]
ALGQGFQAGSITGTVMDESGGVLPGVTVTATHLERGLARTEVTDAQGKFRFVQLPLGPYKLEASLSGFETQVRNNVRVGVERNTDTEFRLGLAAQATEITVTAEAPIVDPTNVTQTTSVSVEEFEKAPIGRSYQTIAALAPGISNNSGGNPNSNGALSSSNQFLYDGVDATDPTTGTFGSNMNFEAIQEVQVQTNGVSAEYGRSTGAIINVITKSGTNDFAGSLKAIVTNDSWNEQNKTKHGWTGASFARNKVDKDDKRYAATLGGPILRDRAWFFGAYEEWEGFPAPSQTTITGEDYASAPVLELHNYRLSWQINPSHQVWGRYGEDPYSGIVRTYTEGTDLYVLTNQTQGGEQTVVQYSGVFGANFALEAMWGEAGSQIGVNPYKIGPFDNGAAIYDLGIAKYFNGNYFGIGNGVDRPRDQMIAAATYFTDLGETTHDIKLGTDLQSTESMSYYSYGNNRLYLVRNYDAATGTFTPVQRRDYVDPGPQRSEGEILSIYLRDKMTLGPRLFVEAGIRMEDQTGQNDVGEDIVDAQTIAPRLAATYDLTGDARTILSATAGRYYDFIIQSFIDGFAENASRANYDLYTWNAAANRYDFTRTVITAGGSTLRPNLDLEPGEMDEYTIGIQRQFGRTMGAGLRYVMRDWNNLIDDFYRFDANKNIKTDYVNLGIAGREYRAIQATLEKRFANNWSMMGNYTYSETEGNHFATTATSLNDHPGYNCRSSDPTVGTIPCDQVTNVWGPPTYDRPHVLNLLGSYAMNLGPVSLTFGGAGYFNSGANYSKTSSVRVLYPDGSQSSESYTYYYEGRGSDRLQDVWQLDGSVEATWNFFQDFEFGVKGEIFNLTDNQDPIATTTQSWTNADTAAGATTRSRHGAQTARTHFQGPRTYRVTGLIRF